MSVVMKLIPYPIGSLIVPIGKAIYQFMALREYRRLIFYTIFFGFKKRYQPLKLHLNGNIVTAPDVASFLSMYKEIYVNKIYELAVPPRRILDLGANIGLSALWLNNMYPESSIVAYEADPEIFEFLKKNVSHIKNITIYNKAIWSHKTELNFSSEGSDGGRVDTNDAKSKNMISTVDIKDVLLDDKFDFIKMDIEGAESVVLPECVGLLANTKYIFFEYHSTVTEEQHISQILSVLIDQNFRIHMHSSNVSKQPFVKINTIAGYDMLLNVFAYKKH
jgi:FkbM family methyltransferase